MIYKASTAEEYLAQIPEDRAVALRAIREVILQNLPAGYEEMIQYGMIGYVVPHSIYPAGYHCDPKQPLPFAHIGSQKNHMALYLFCLYGDEETSERFRADWVAAGKSLDAGKGCIRFKKLEDVPLDVVGQVIAQIPVAKFLARWEDVLAQNKIAAKERSDARKAAKAQPLQVDP